MKALILATLMVVSCYGHHGVTRERCSLPQNRFRFQCLRGFARLTFRPVLRPRAPIRVRTTVRPRNRFSTTTQASSTRIPISRVPGVRVAVIGGPVTRVPFTMPPATRAPVTRAPVTRAPVTRAPVTRAPITRAPVTRAPVTRAPVTTASVTRAPVTNPPTTPATTSQKTTTQATTTQAQKQPTQQTNGTRIGPIRSELQSMLKSNTNLIPAWVQLGFHVCVGGCDGCLDLTEPDNKGLKDTYSDIRDIYTKHQGDITLADLVTLAAVEAGNEGMRRGGGPGKIPLRIGRKTCSNPDKPEKDGEFPQGNDPNALNVIMKEFGLSRQEAVALLGAHSLGRCKSENSGFEGAWDNTPTHMDNGYYRALIGTTWQVAQSPGGSSQWMVNPNNIGGSRMMLHPDMRLIKSFTTSGRNDTPSCISECSASSDAPLVSRFASNPHAFFNAFTPAYVKMLENTVDSLRAV